MNSPQRDAPSGVSVPTDKGLSDNIWWVFVAIVVSAIAGVGVGWWEKDAMLGAWIAGSLYVLFLLTIIAMKD